MDRLAELVAPVAELRRADGLPEGVSRNVVFVSEMTESTDDPDVFLAQVRRHRPERLYAFAWEDREDGAVALLALMLHLGPRGVAGLWRTTTDVPADVERAYQRMRRPMNESIRYGGWVGLAPKVAAILGPLIYLLLTGAENDLMGFLAFGGLLAGGAWLFRSSFHNPTYLEGVVDAPPTRGAWINAHRANICISGFFAALPFIVSELWSLVGPGR